jgi:hypothetical protein
MRKDPDDARAAFGRDPGIEGEIAIKASVSIETILAGGVIMRIV